MCCKSKNPDGSFQGEMFLEQEKKLIATCDGSEVNITQSCKRQLGDKEITVTEEDGEKVETCNMTAEERQQFEEQWDDACAEHNIEAETGEAKDTLSHPCDGEHHFFQSSSDEHIDKVGSAVPKGSEDLADKKVIGDSNQSQADLTAKGGDLANEKSNEGKAVKGGKEVGDSKTGATAKGTQAEELISEELDIDCRKYYLQVQDGKKLA
jgi:hypothetical protein